MNVLVLGASGYIGSNLVPHLLARGYGVRAASRRREVLEGRGWIGAELVEADALDPASLPQALNGIQVAYYLVHSMGSGADFAEKDRHAAENFRIAAEAAGVRRIIYLGGLQGHGANTRHLQSRKETGEVLRAGNIPVTELRAGIIVGAGSAAFEVIRDLVNHLPVMTTPRWVRSKTQPIALDNLLEYLSRLLDAPLTEGKIYDVAGPETLRYDQLITQFGAAVGKKRLIIPLPVLTPRLSSYWLDLVTSVPASVARPLIDGLKEDLLANDAAIRVVIPIPLATYREAIDAALRHERELALPARWTEGALAFRGYDPSVSYYSKGARTELHTDVPSAVVWAAVQSIGGKRGYYYANSLWRLRGLLDRIVGGVGMRRGRRHPTELRIGDAVDFWRVVAIEPGTRLTLV
ncbi:MAG: DUF2867 domain-containing protein, partial [Tepidiformaceae bacterium]